ncbi:MAG: DsbA family protein [Gammaproteobacteria bacterium]
MCDNAVMFLRKNIICFAAAAAFCAPAFAQSSASEFSPRQRDALRELFAAFPDAESLRAARAQIGADIKRRAIAMLHGDDSLPAFGAADGATIVEFSDYQCGFCKKMFKVLRAENARIKVVEFPVLGELSVKAARYALAARDQNGYDAFHIALMERGGRLTEDGLEEAAAAAHLDFDRLQRDSENPKISAALQKNRRLAAMLEVRGTPFLIIGDRTVPGAINADRLKNLLNAAAQ